MKTFLFILVLLITFNSNGWDYSVWTNSTLKIVKITSHKIKVGENITPPYGHTLQYVTNTILKAEFHISNLPTIGSFSITSGSGTNVLDLNGSLNHSLSVTFDETYTNIVSVPDNLGNDLTFPQPQIQLTDMEAMGGYRHNKIEHSITTWITICFTNQFPSDFKFFTRLPKAMPPMIFWKLHVIEYSP